MSHSGVFTRSEAAAYLRISVRQLNRIVASGRIAFYRVGSSPRFSADQLDDYLASVTVQARVRNLARTA